MRIPVKAAKEFAEKHEKDQVIVVSWSKKDNKTWVTTYGNTQEDCDQAAQAGNHMKRELLNWPESHCVAEPSRVKNLKNKLLWLKNLGEG